MSIRKEQIIGLLVFVILGQIIAGVIWGAIDKNYFFALFFISVFVFLLIGQIIKGVEKREKSS